MNRDNVSPKSQTRLGLKNMLLKQRSPLKIQVVLKTGKISPLALWIPHHPRKSQNQKERNGRHEEYKEVITDFYQALNKPQNSNTKPSYEICREKIGQYKLCLDANKLANVRQNIY